MFNTYRKLDKLTPEMRKRVEAFLTKCDAHQLNVMITETWRSKARQLWLWAKGRMVTPDLEKRYLGYDHPSIYSKPGERQVTWTLDSQHQKGTAIDICFKNPDGSIHYSGDWNKVFDCAEACGLESLFRKHGFDKPHLQFNPKWESKVNKEKIKHYEQQFKIESNRLNRQLQIFNRVVEKLSKEKRVEYKPFRIAR